MRSSIASRKPETAAKRAGRQAVLGVCESFAGRASSRAVCHDILHFSVRVLGTVWLRRPRQKQSTGSKRESGLVALCFPPSDHTCCSAVNGSTAGQPGLDRFRCIGGDSAGDRRERLACRAGAVSIDLHSGLACCFPRDLKLTGNLVSSREVHLVRRLAPKCRMRKTRVVLLDVVSGEPPDAVGGDKDGNGRALDAGLIFRLHAPSWRGAFWFAHVRQAKTGWRRGLIGPSPLRQRHSTKFPSCERLEQWLCL